MNENKKDKDPRLKPCFWDAEACCLAMRSYVSNLLNVAMDNAGI